MEYIVTQLDSRIKTLSDLFSLASSVRYTEDETPGNRYLRLPQTAYLFYEYDLLGNMRWIMLLDEPGTMLEFSSVIDVLPAVHNFDHANLEQTGIAAKLHEDLQRDFEAKAHKDLMLLSR
jgi:hypothetical protein